MGKKVGEDMVGLVEGKSDGVNEGEDEGETVVPQNKVKHNFFGDKG